MEIGEDERRAQWMKRESKWLRVWKKNKRKKERKTTMLFYLACLHGISYFRVCGYIRGWCYEFSRFIRLQNDLIVEWSVWGATFFRAHTNAHHPTPTILAPFASFPRARSHTHTTLISLYILWCELCEKHDTMYASNGIVGHSIYHLLPYINSICSAQIFPY